MATIDVTSNSDWSSSDIKIFTVTNSSGETYSKGYITPKKVGTAYLSVSYDKYSVTATVSVSAAKLTHIEVKLNPVRGGALYSGDKADIITTGYYADDTTKIISAPKITVDNAKVELDGNSLTAVSVGEFTISVEYEGYHSSINGMVEPPTNGIIIPEAPKITGIRIVESEIALFTTGIPQTKTVRAQFVWSDGKLTDIPASTLDKPTLTECDLFKLPDDKNIPFLNLNSKCEITSTNESGQNRLTYRYIPLNQKGEIDYTQPIFESSIIIKSVDTPIKQIKINSDFDYNFESKLVVGNVYRYKVFAILDNNESVDITKSLKLNVILTSENDSSDYSGKLSVSNAGYIGAGEGYEDGFGGFIKLNSAIHDNDNEALVKVKLQVSARLTRFSVNKNYNLTSVANVISTKAIGSYFIEKIYPTLSRQDQYSFITFSGFNGNKINQSPYTTMFSTSFFRPVLAGTLQLKPISSNPSLSFENNITVQEQVDLLTPRVSDMGIDENAKSLVTVACNNSQTNQTISTSSSSVSLATTTTFGRGFSVGLDISREFAAALIGNTQMKTTVKVSGAYNQSWSWSDTKTDTYTLPSQNILLPPGAKSIVLQKFVKGNLSYTSDLLLPMNGDSCIPVEINANPTILYNNAYKYSSTACFRLNSFIDHINDPLFTSLFDGSKHMRFKANVAQQGYDKSKINTISVYVFNPQDPGYSSLTCTEPLMALQSGSNKHKPTKAKLSKDQLSVEVNGKLIPLRNKNLRSVKTYQN